MDKNGVPGMDKYLEWVRTKQLGGVRTEHLGGVSQTRGMEYLLAKNFIHLMK